MDVRQYLNNRVDPFLKPLLVDLIRTRPENVHEYIGDWLNTTGAGINDNLNSVPKEAEPQPANEQAQPGNEQPQPANEEPVNPPTEEAPAPEQPVAE